MIVFDAIEYLVLSASSYVCVRPEIPLQRRSILLALAQLSSQQNNAIRMHIDVCLQYDYLELSELSSATCLSSPK